MVSSAVSGAHARGVVESLMLLREWLWWSERAIVLADHCCCCCCRMVVVLAGHQVREVDVVALMLVVVCS